MQEQDIKSEFETVLNQLMILDEEVINMLKTKLEEDRKEKATSVLYKKYELSLPLCVATLINKGGFFVAKRTNSYVWYPGLVGSAHKILSPESSPLVELDCVELDCHEGPARFLEFLKEAKRGSFPKKFIVPYGFAFFSWRTTEVGTDDKKEHRFLMVDVYSKKEALSKFKKRPGWSWASDLLYDKFSMQIGEKRFSLRCGDKEEFILIQEIWSDGFDLI